MVILNFTVDQVCDDAFIYLFICKSTFRNIRGNYIRHIEEDAFSEKIGMPNLHVV